MSIEEIKQKILSLLSEQNLTKKQIATALWLSDRKIELVLKELRNSNLVYYTGKGYSLIPKKTKPIRKKAKPVKVSKSVSIPILRVIFAVLAICGSIVSVRNTSVYLVTTFPIVWAFMLSGMMSLFMMSAFSIMVLFWNRKQYFLAVSIGCLFVLVTTASMASTTIGMYNAQKESFVEKTGIERIDNNNAILYNQYEKEISDIQKLIEAKQITINRYNKMIEPYTSTSSKDYKTLSWNIYEAEVYIADLTKQIKEIRREKETLINNNMDVDIVIEDFFDMMERITGISSSIMSFIMSLIVALFVDIIAPIGGSMALFLKEK